MFIYANAFFWIIFLNTKIDANDAKKSQKYIRVILRRITFSFRIRVSERNSQNHATYFRATRLHNSNLVSFSMKKPKNRYFWKKNDKNVTLSRKKLDSIFPSIWWFLMIGKKKQHKNVCIFIFLAYIWAIFLDTFKKSFQNRDMFFLDFFFTIEAFERQWLRKYFLAIVCYPH